MRHLLTAGLMLACAAAGPTQAACIPGQVDLRWPGGQARFTVEVAADQAAREKGLMFREHIKLHEVRQRLADQTEGSLPLELMTLLNFCEASSLGKNGRAREALRNTPAASVEQKAA